MITDNKLLSKVLLLPYPEMLKIHMIISSLLIVQNKLSANNTHFMWNLHMPEVKYESIQYYLRSFLLSLIPKLNMILLCQSIRSILCPLA